VIVGMLLGIVTGLLANELFEFSPWCARKLVRWSALRRYTDPGRAELRAEELTRLINDRPGNLFKLTTAVGFAAAAVIVAGRRAFAHEPDAGTGSDPALPEVSGPSPMEVVEQTAVAMEGARLAMLRKKLADMGLEPPAPTWRVMALLGVLGLGDLTMTSVAMMMLNISDHLYVSWLPFSALQAAAIPVVGGMLAAAHYLGESVKAHRYEPRPHLVIKVVGGAALLGGLSLALSVAFLTANGVPALSLPFIGIQLGLFAVATAASAWAAHPYRAEWRQAVRAVRRAAKN
jgi:hypothetical protein